MYVMKYRRVLFCSLLCNGVHINTMAMRVNRQSVCVKRVFPMYSFTILVAGLCYLAVVQGKYYTNTHTIN